MISPSLCNQTVDAIDKISQSNSTAEISAALGSAVEELGFAAFGINGLPPPGEGADPIVLTERAPDGFRDFYIEERFYLVDHICAHARAAHEPFRYSEASFSRENPRGHRRFMEALDNFGLGRGLIVPIGRPANVPACIWLAGKNPDLHDGAKQAVQLISLFAASKAYALSRASRASRLISPLRGGEREVLQWIAAGKTSWEIGAISGRSERTVNKIIGEAMKKLNAVSRAQAVANAIQIGELEL